MNIHEAKKISENPKPCKRTILLQARNRLNAEIEECQAMIEIITIELKGKK